MMKSDAKMEGLLVYRKRKGKRNGLSYWLAKKKGGKYQDQGKEGETKRD